MTTTDNDAARATSSVFSLSAALTQSIAQRIQQRTAGRIQLLAVEVIGDRVVVRGLVSSYHIKQLALQGVLDVVGGGSGGGRIELEVEVAGSPSKLGAKA